MPERGKFFVFEGVDGSGKSTRSQIAVNYLESLGLKVLFLAEPVKNVVGDAIRKIVGQSEEKLPLLAQAFLFSANRAYAYETIIRPALEDGTWIVMDRSWLSTISYQGYGEGFGDKSLLKALDTITQIAIKETFFDFCVICDISVSTALDRINLRGNKKDYFEKQNSEYLDRVRQGYLDALERYSYLKFYILNTENNTKGDVEIMKSEIMDLLKPYLGGKV